MSYSQGEDNVSNKSVMSLVSNIDNVKSHGDKAIYKVFN